MIFVSELPFAGTLLVCDMDGTLLNSQRKLSEENRTALERFVALGGWFTVATGRSEKSVQCFLPELPINVPVIVYNGALLYDMRMHKKLWYNFLHDDVMEIVKELFVKFPEMGIEILHEGEVYFLRENEETDRHMKREKLVMHRIPLEEIPKPWYKVLLAWENHKLKEVEKYLMGRLDSSRTVFSEPELLEILHRSTSKGQALKKLTDLLQCPNQKVIAMGDNLNDLELICTAGTGIAVANAHEAVKKAASFNCCHHDEHAAEEVVKWMMEIQGIEW